MFNYFIMPNIAFESNLTATEIAVLAVLCSQHSCHTAGGCKVIKIKQSTIAQRIGKKQADTISKAIVTLQQKGFILRSERNKRANGKLGTYTYFMPNTKALGGYFKVSRYIFKRYLTCAELRMYLFINKCICAHCNYCFNSFNDIAEKLKLCRSTVISTINKLVTYGLISKLQCKNSNGSYTDNHYMLAAIDQPKYKIAKKAKEPHTHSAALSSCVRVFIKTSGVDVHIYNFACYYNKIFLHRCQYLYHIRGSPIKPMSLDITHYP